MRESVTVRILTPEASVAEGEADFVALPAEGGDLAIHPGHTTAAIALRPGELRTSGEGESGEGNGALPQLLAISGGYAEVRRDNPPSGAEDEPFLHSTVVIYARTVERPEEIDVARARAAAERARRRLAEPGKDVDIPRARAALARALARLRVAEAAGGR